MAQSGKGEQNHGALGGERLHCNVTEHAATYGYAPSDFAHHGSVADVQFKNSAGRGLRFDAGLCLNGRGKAEDNFHLVLADGVPAQIFEFRFPGFCCLRAVSPVRAVFSCPADFSGGLASRILFSDSVSQRQSEASVIQIF